jgi:hypothetical protein
VNLRGIRNARSFGSFALLAAHDWEFATDKRKNLRDECCQSRTLLFDVTPTDPAVFGFTLIVIIGVGLAAALVPACWASALDLMATPRTE